MRCFLCLMPDAETALAIDHWRCRHWPIAGREVPVQNLHMTLSFLGEVDEDRLERLAHGLDDKLADRLALDVRFDQPCWRADSSVAWLSCTTTPESLLQLAKRLRELAGRSGIRVDKRTFVPHVTLARRVDHPPPPPLSSPDILCRFEELSLVESLLDPRGVRYRELASWPARH